MKTDTLERKFVLALLIIGLLLSAFFGLRAAHSFARIHQGGLHPGTTDVNAIRGWMTIPYIARVYDVPKDYLYRQIGVPLSNNDEKSLGDLNREYFFAQPGVVLQKVKDAISQYEKPASSIPQRAGF